MPSGVTSIGDSAFASCTRLSALSIGSGVLSLGDYAFYQCSALTVVIVPNSVSVIGANAFDTCTLLTSVTIGSGVSSIGGMAFFDCSSLTVIKFLGLSAPAIAVDDWIGGTPDAVRGRALAASDLPAPWVQEGDATFHGLKMGAYLTAPGVPTALNAVPGNGQVLLSWSAPADDGGRAITGYRVYRSTSEFGTYALIASPSTTSFVDTGRSNGQQYWYQVSALNAIGEGGLSAPLSATPYTVPNAPLSLSAEPGDEQAILNWAAPSFNGGRAIDYYVVYQDREDVLHTAALTATLTGLASGQSYFLHRRGSQSGRERRPVGGGGGHTLHRAGRSPADQHRRWARFSHADLDRPLLRWRSSDHALSSVLGYRRPPAAITSPTLPRSSP